MIAEDKDSFLKGTFVLNTTETPKHIDIIITEFPDEPSYEGKTSLGIYQQIENKVKAAIQMEGRISTQKIPENTLAVLYLVNNNEDATWNALSKGLTQLMISDLSMIKSITLTDRIELQILLKELQFDQNQMNDEKEDE